MGALGILEQEDTMKCRWSQLHALFFVFIQHLKETT
jgi:hypothetical protein